MKSAVQLPPRVQSAPVDFEKIREQLNRREPVAKKQTPILHLFLPIFIGLALLVALDCLIAWTPLDNYFNTLLSRDLLIKAQEMKAGKLQAVNTLAMGSSRTLYGFATPSFNDNQAQQNTGIDAYNLGLAGADVKVYKYWLKNFIQHYGKPKLLLLEISEFQMSRTGLSPNAVNYLENEIAVRPEFLFELLKSDNLGSYEKKELTLSAISRIYRYKDILDFRHLTKAVLHPAPTDPIEQGWMKASKLRSYMSKPDALPLAASSRFTALMKSRYPGPNDTISKFLDYCKQEKIPVVIVNWPLHPEYYRLVQNTPSVAEKRNQIIDAYHLPFIDLNQYITPESAATQFTDIDHLNQAGAVYYTEKLQEELKKLSL